MAAKKDVSMSVFLYYYIIEYFYILYIGMGAIFWRIVVFSCSSGLHLLTRPFDFLKIRFNEKKSGSLPHMNLAINNNHNFLTSNRQETNGSINLLECRNRLHVKLIKPQILSINNWHENRICNNTLDLVIFNFEKERYNDRFDTNVSPNSDIVARHSLKPLWF